MSLVAALVTATVLVTAALAAVAPPTGNKPAIGFYKHEVAHYFRLPGAKVVETGYFFVAPSGGTSVRFWWGRPPPPGFVPATATILEQLSEGKIVAYLAQLTAPKVRHVRVLMAGSSVFISSSKCWSKASATSSPLGTGETFLFNDGGASLPAARHGHRVDRRHVHLHVESGRAGARDGYVQPRLDADGERRDSGHGDADDAHRERDHAAQHGSSTTRTVATCTTGAKASLLSPLGQPSNRRPSPGQSMI